VLPKREGNLYVKFANSGHYPFTCWRGLYHNSKAFSHQTFTIR
jgi:hypothetical protein